MRIVLREAAMIEAVGCCGAGRLPRRRWQGGKNDSGEQSKQKGWGSTGDH